MSTAPIRCPDCDEWIRVAVQPSLIEMRPPEGLRVVFHPQMVAHVCKEKKQ